MARLSAKARHKRQLKARLKTCPTEHNEEQRIELDSPPPADAVSSDRMRKALERPVAKLKKSANLKRKIGKKIKRVDLPVSVQSEAVVINEHETDEQPQITFASPPSPPSPPPLPYAEMRTDRTVRLGNGSSLRIGGLSDEHGTRYAWFQGQGKIVVTLLSNWHNGAGDGSTSLLQGGIIIPGSIKDVREAVDRLRNFPQVPIVIVSGWSKYGFALVDGRVLVAPGQAAPLVQFAPIPGLLDEGGTLEGWIETVATPLAGHVIPAFFLLAMFAAPILELINRTDNFGFELSGGAGLGKSTVLHLVASAAGRAFGGGDLYWRTLNATINALEAIAPAFNGMALILDEAGLVQGAGRPETRAIAMREMAFRLATGKGKERFGQPSGPRSRFVSLISTNVPLMSLLGALASEEAEAIADRVLTLPLLPDRPYGVFDSCPPEHDDTKAFAASLEHAAGIHYGYAFPVFMEYLVERRHRAPKRLKALMEKFVSRFISRAGIDRNNGSHGRVAEAFGLVYAAGRLAQKAKVLPDTYDCLAIALAAHRLHRSDGRTALSFDERLAALLRSPRLIDLTRKGGEKVPRKPTVRVCFFLYSGKSNDRQLVIPADRIEAIFPDWKRISKGAEVRARLLPSSERLTRDRPVGPKGVQTSCYVFRIADLIEHAED